jgi:hypothetical protein
MASHFKKTAILIVIAVSTSNFNEFVVTGYNIIKVKGKAILVTGHGGP